MFVNIPPTAASVQETLCSLRFASQVLICVTSFILIIDLKVKNCSGKPGRTRSGEEIDLQKPFLNSCLIATSK